MTFDDYMQEVLTRRQTGLARDQRAGQFYFNVLHDVRRRLAKKVQGTSVDPTFDDGRLPEFLTYVARHWND